MSEEVVIKVENLSKVYKLYDKPIDRLKESLNPFKKKYHHDFYALKDINFEIKRGEKVGIIGANGAGKSTLLKILTGVLSPSSGKFSVNGHISSLLELGTGFNPELTGVQNLYFYGTINGLTRHEMDALRDDIIAFADIGDYINQPLRTYSSGMLARLAFAVAVQVNPEILIIDEALSVGDMRFQQRAIRKMNELMSKAKALLFVSHSIPTLKTLCNRAIWLKNGEIIQAGDTAQVTRNYTSFMKDGLIIEEGEDLEVSNIVSKEEIDKIERTINVNTELKWNNTEGFDNDGDKRATIEKVAFYTLDPFEPVTTLQGGEWVTFLAVIKANEDISNLAFSFSINDSLTNAMVAVNTFFHKKQIPDINTGERVFIKISFRVPLLKNGEYFSNVSMSERDAIGKSIMHRVYDCIQFKIDNKSDLHRQGGVIVVNEVEIFIDRFV